MESRIRQRMTPEHLTTAALAFGIAAADLVELDAFESFIYEMPENRILRISHSLRRSIHQIQAEADWISFLHKGGASVARAIPSPAGLLVEAIQDNQGDQFLAVCFEKALGKHVTEMGGWNRALVANYGRLLGTVHRLTTQYPSDGSGHYRGKWNDPQHLEIGSILADDSILMQKYDLLMAHLNALPESAEAFGMIHQDAHAGNFFVDAHGNLTLFDFDDCLYGHFAYDLAMVLFYAVTNRADVTEFGPEFWACFKEAYLAEYPLQADWFQEIPYFMKLRELDLYTIITRDEPDAPADSWAGRFMAGRRELIEAEVPCVKFPT